MTWTTGMTRMTGMTEGQKDMGTRGLGDRETSGPELKNLKRV
jgi:hypothetical protein